MKITSPDGHNFSVDGVVLDPKPSLKIISHSPDGFSCGYWGSGPTQLALALLMCVVDPITAQEAKIDFRNEHVSSWPVDGPVDIDLDIRNWYADWAEKKADETWR